MERTHEKLKTTMNEVIFHNLKLSWTINSSNPDNQKLLFQRSRLGPAPVVFGVDDSKVDLGPQVRGEVISTGDKGL